MAVDVVDGESSPTKFLYRFMASQIVVGRTMKTLSIF